MLEQPTSARTGSRLLSYVVGLLALAALVAAVVVVVKSLGKVKPGPAPVTLKPEPLDTLGRKLKHNLTTRLRTQQRRIKKYRGMQSQLSPQQESLALSCESMLDRLQGRFVRFDSLPGLQPRRALYDSLMQEYTGLRASIKELGRSVGSTDVGEDSLDAELHKLLSD